MAFRVSKRLRLAAMAGFGAAALAGLAQAQTMSTNSASFNAGYGRYSGQENQPVNVDMTDTNGNLVVVNGLFQAGGASMFAGASARLSGAADSFSGAGSTGSASAIGNNLNVVVQGSDNTVIVQSQQTNTGTVIATTNTNGKP